MPIEVGGRRFYAIMVAEKGYETYRIRVHGRWGHGSMPRDDNALVRAAHVVTRVAVPSEARPTPVVRRLLADVGNALPPDQAALMAAIVDDDPRRSAAALRAACDPAYAIMLDALLHDTFSPTIMHAGIKYNVIPGEAVIQVDCRTLPGTTEGDAREELMARIGDLMPFCEIENIIRAAPVEAPAEGALYEAMAAAIRAHDPDGIPVPVIAPFATDAKHTARLGVPTYGFCPSDGRRAAVPRPLPRGGRAGKVDALRWGLPVLYDVVAGYCAGTPRRPARRSRFLPHVLQRNRLRTPHDRSTSMSAGSCGWRSSTISPQLPSW